MPLIAPPTIDETVLQFAATISDQPPVFIPVKPVYGSVAAHCFGSVLRHSKGAGGKLVTGWAIWTHPDVYIEAEHHGVWEDADGNLIDITPKPDGEKEILFVRDDSAVPVNETSRNNIRKALINDMTVIAMIRAADKFYPYFAINSRRERMDAKMQKIATKAHAAKNATIAAFNAKFPS